MKVPAGSVRSRRDFLQLSAAAAAGGGLVLSPVPAQPRPGESATAGLDDRGSWLDLMERVAEPVLTAMSRRALRRTMPVEARKGSEAERAVGSPLEAFARLLAGLAPFLEWDSSAEQTPREVALRARYRGLAQAAIASAVDPASPDYMQFGASGQTLVDSSFLALALLRAPKVLLGTLDPATRGSLIAALLRERTVQPPFNNWLLFAALNEVLLRALGAPWDRMRVDYALREHQSWYLGDGVYGDGPHFHADFYNSFVIQPYLLAILDAVGEEPAWKGMARAVVQRAVRYAEIQERMIGPGGEYPPLGRSITYRAGAFHLLAEIARRRLLPETLQPAAVRCALTAVQQATLQPAETFSAQGWLQIGLAGHQPSLGEGYISTGSLYLCSAVWMPLGLPPEDPFWSGAPAGWTQKRVWAGQDSTADHSQAD